MFDALVSFTFNLGAGTLKRSTLLKKLNRNDIDGAAAEFDRFIYAGGKIMRGLVRRRAAEKEIFLNGNYLNNESTEVWLPCAVTTTRYCLPSSK